jgi:hypothetical protein
VNTLSLVPHTKIDVQIIKVSILVKSDIITTVVKHSSGGRMLTMWNNTWDYINVELRHDCKMRHENGNCLPCGGFCTAVNNEICSALHNAYNHGFNDCYEIIRNSKN